jgi:hypothetical protein
MESSRPWLSRMHGVGFEKDDEKTGGTGGGAGSGSGTGTGTASKPSLADLLTQHPHLKDELATEVQRVGTREKEQGKRSGLQDFLAQNGLGEIADPTVVVDGYRKFMEAQQAQMTDAERLRSEAEQAKALATKALADAKQERFDAKAIRLLQQAGAEDAELLAATLGRLGVTVDSDDEAIKAAVTELKKRSPGAFAGKAKGTPGTGNPGGPPAGSPGGTGDGKAPVGQLAQSQIERMYPKQKQRA